MPAYTLTRLSAIDGEAILSLAAAKLWLRVDSDKEDGLISGLRDAAIAYVERRAGIALAPSDYRWAMRGFDGLCRPGRDNWHSRRATGVELPVRPVTEVLAVRYNGEDGSPRTYADWRLVENSVFPAFGAMWPSSFGYAAIEFTAGLASPEDARPLLTAVEQMLSHLYHNREAVQVSSQTAQELPLGVAALIDSYREVQL